MTKKNTSASEPLFEIHTPRGVIESSVTRQLLALELLGLYNEFNEPLGALALSAAQQLDRSTKGYEANAARAQLMDCLARLPQIPASESKGGNEFNELVNAIRQASSLD